MDDTSTATLPETGFELHSGRGPFNARFFRAMGPYLERRLHSRKRRVFAGLPQEVVEIGSGVGANLRYLPAGGRLVAIEPNRYMHDRLRPRQAATDWNSTCANAWPRRRACPTRASTA